MRRDKPQQKAAGPGWFQWPQRPHQTQQSCLQVWATETTFLWAASFLVVCLQPPFTVQLWDFCALYLLLLSGRCYSSPTSGFISQWRTYERKGQRRMGLQGLHKILVLSKSYSGPWVKLVNWDWDSSFRHHRASSMSQCLMCVVGKTWHWLCWACLDTDIIGGTHEEVLAPAALCCPIFSVASPQIN